MSGLTIYCLVSFIGTALFLIVLKFYYHISKLKGIKIKYDPPSLGEEVAVLFFSPIMFPFIIFNTINKLLDILIHNISKFIVNFDASKIKNIF